MTREAAVTALLLAALAGVAMAGAVADAPFTVTLATRAAILATAAAGLNLAVGAGGMVSLGHAAFYGIGGYAVGILAANVQDAAGWGTTSMPLVWVIAASAGGLAAAAIGAISLRTGGVYFIMITLAFAQMIWSFAIAWPAYGGEDGISIWRRNAFPGVNTLDPATFFVLAFAVLLGVLALLARLRGSFFGLALDAARQNAARAAASGVEVYRLRLAAFALSGAITALAGALMADLNRFVSPAMLGWQTSGELLVLVILGGVGRLAGPVAGAGAFVALEHWLGASGDHWLLYLGAVLLGVVLFARGGILGLLAGRPRG